MQTEDERLEAAAEEGVRSLAITPLAFPLLVGAAEIAVMITLANDAGGWQGRAILVCSAITTAALVGVTLWLALPITRLLGKTGINVATRVMALFVAAIAVHFIMTGLRHQLPRARLTSLKRSPRSRTPGQHRLRNLERNCR